jgi:hypothetical protein
MGLYSNGRTVQWDGTHYGSNPSARTFYWIYSEIFRRYALSSKRRSRRRQGISGDFKNLQKSRSTSAQSFGCAHRGRVCVRVFML